MISDIIAKDTKSGGFVYSFIGSIDKLASGSFIFLAVTVSGNPSLLRWMVAFTPILCSLLALGLTFFGSRKFKKKLQKMTLYIKKKGPAEETHA